MKLSPRAYNGHTQWILNDIELVGLAVAGLGYPTAIGLSRGLMSELLHGFAHCSRRSLGSIQKKASRTKNQKNVQRI